MPRRQPGEPVWPHWPKEANARFLEVFSGGDGISRKLRKTFGWDTISWDIKKGDHYDLTRPSAVRHLMSLLASATLVHWATPCRCKPLNTQIGICTMAM